MIFQLFQLLFDFVSIHNIFKICFLRMSNKIKTLYAEPTNESENNFCVLKTNNQYVTVIKLCINLIKIPSNKTNIKIPKNLYCA